MAAIIFDFDGTIADSFARVVKIAEDLTNSHVPLSDAEIEKLRGMSAFQVARELKIRPWKIPFLLARGRARMRGEMSKIAAFKGVPETIKALSAAGHTLYIMSSNSVSNIEVFLEQHNLAQHFVEIYGSVGIFSKARVLKKVLKQNNLNVTSTLYIGDEVRDIEAAKQCRVRTAAVTWGYNNAKILGAHEPDFLATKPKDLLRIV